MAVRLVVVLLECSLVQLFQAESTHEMLGVKLFKHGRDTPTGDGLLT